MSPLASTDGSSRTRWLPSLVLVVGFLLATAGPVLMGLDHFPSKSIDMDRNHVPVIRAFAVDWPAPGLQDYDSATTPGMHVVLAGLITAFGDSETMLQLATCMFGGFLAWIAWWFASRVVGGWIAVACVLPLACSPYVLGNAIWVMTDDLALALVAISVGVAIFQRPSISGASVSGVAMVCSVLVRQINVWPTAVAWLATILGASAVRRRLPFRDRFDEGSSAIPTLVLGVGVLAAFAVLGAFVLLWGGLVPPSFQPGGGGAAVHSGGLNLAVTPYVLSLVGVYGLPAMVVLLPLWREDSGVRRNGLIGAGIGVLVGVLLHSAPGIEHGRVGGWLWTLADRGPVLGGRSIVLFLGSGLGGFTTGALFGLVSRADRSRAAWLMLGFAVSFLAAYTANAQAFQRYFDPPVLLALGWALSLSSGASTSGGVVSSGRIAWAGVGMGGLQVVFAVATLYLKLGFPPAPA